MSAVPIEQTATRPGAMASPQLRTLALCDLVESTALVEELGDQRAAELMRRLDRITRDLLHRHGGREIDKTDGFLVLFDRPIRAVAFALDYQRQLHDLGRAEFLPLRARIGIHVGDVMLWENEPADIAQGAKPLEVEGLIKPVAARLMTLARPGQTLLSGIAYSLAQRAQGELDREQAAPIWKSHGNYRFKGVGDPVAVYEVGMPGIAPLRAPPWSSKAHREVPWYRRPGMLVVEIAVLLAAVAVPAYTFLRSPPAIAFAKRDWVVVGDFKNLTGESVFDGSLQTAFRIGLEQSRYVNLLSDLKVRDTLKLMQRDPEQTAVDRAVGSEIAIREGARAVILPMIAEIGGHVRVTAEVIDPKTQSTVYSESADGTGAESVLPSIDKVNTQLRLRLGEALATVSGDSLPLDKVATKNLDALRAYALGQKAYDTGDMKGAFGHYEQALKLDPDFAMAFIAVARTHISSGENSLAQKAIQRAADLRDRLSSRDALFVDAWQTTLNDPRAALEKWKLTTRLYQVFYPALGAYANTAWYANRFDVAINAAKAAATAHNAHAAVSQYLLGIAYLSVDRYPEAKIEFDNAASAGYAAKGYPALLFAINRDFDKASAFIDGKTQPCGADFERVLFCVDRGEIEQARGFVDQLIAQAADARQAAKLTGIALYLKAISTGSWAHAFSDYANTESTASFDNGVDTSESRFHGLFAAYLMLREAGSDSTDPSVLRALNSPSASDDFPLSNMRGVAKAQQKLAMGQPAEAIDMLRKYVDGNELYLTHVALLDAYAQKKDYAAAIREADWLMANRGRAYAEFGEHQFVTPFNVAESDLAILRDAELSHLSGNDKQARELVQRFHHVWKDAPKLASVNGRLQSLEGALAK